MFKKFVLWGHRLNDYKEMFNLSDDTLSEKQIVEYGAGVTGFNAEMNAKGFKVVSIDPMYDLTLKDIKTIVDEIFDTTVAKVKKNKDKYNWKNHEELTTLIDERRAGIELFYNDFELGREQGRYLGSMDAKLLKLEECNFDLALITHHLFVNFDDKGVGEHVELIEKMIELAGDVQIFPLLDKYGQISKLLGPVMLQLQQNNLGLEVCQVGSQLQKSGNAMLRVWAVECDVKPLEKNNVFTA